MRYSEIISSVFTAKQHW